VRAVGIDDRGIGGTAATVATAAGAFTLTIALPGHGHLLNALAAAAVGLELGVDTATIARELATLAPADHRGVTLATPSGATILDDSYNSSPAALMRALDALGASRPAGRRVAVLGEMLELGDQSAALHDACGRHAVAAGVQRLVTVVATRPAAWAPPPSAPDFPPLPSPMRRTVTGRRDRRAGARRR
jgi:UDP-N-acetylmuramoyl-tripeptide--D-alanyl-D-alanine ligase